MTMRGPIGVLILAAVAFCLAGLSAAEALNKQKKPTHLELDTAIQQDLERFRSLSGTYREERDSYHEMFAREHDSRIIAEAQLAKMRSELRGVRAKINAMVGP